MNDNEDPRITVKPEWRRLPSDDSIAYAGAVLFAMGVVTAGVIMMILRWFS